MHNSAFSQEMLHYFSQLNDAEKKSVVEMIRTFLHSKKTESSPVSLEEYNRELEQADAEIEAGEFVSHEEVTKRYRKP